MPKLDDEIERKLATAVQRAGAKPYRPTYAPTADEVRIIGWLRTQPETRGPSVLADAIERGDHARHGMG